MKELSDETSASQVLAESERRADAPVSSAEAPDAPREIFIFDGWGMVPLDQPKT